MDTLLDSEGLRFVARRGSEVGAKIVALDTAESEFCPRQLEGWVFSRSSSVAEEVAAGAQGKKQIVASRCP